MEKSLFLPEGTTVTGFVVLGDFWPLLWIWLIAVNAAAFLVFGLDKWKAKRTQAHPRTRRVPEKTLFLLAALGGSVGALLGMRVWHHKTLHRSFLYGIPAILLAELAAGIALWWLLR